MVGRWLFFVIAFLLVIATTHRAHALLISDIPDASYLIAVSGLGNSSTPSSGVGTVTEGFCDPGSGGGCQTATATVDGATGSISGSQHCDLNTSCPTSTQATAQVSTALFYAVIDSANPTETTTTVPLMITASIETGVSGTGAAGTSVSGTIVWGLGSDFIKACTLLGASFCPNPGPGFGSDASVTDSPYSIQADTVQRIDLTISGGTSWSAAGSGFTASLDPLVEIDPTWLLNHPGFILVFSPNIPVPATSVPEPSSMALLGVGLFGLGLIRRRKRSRESI